MRRRLRALSEGPPGGAEMGRIVTFRLHRVQVAKGREAKQDNARPSGRRAGVTEVAEPHGRPWVL